MDENGSFVKRREKWENTSCKKDQKRCEKAWSEKGETETAETNHNGRIRTHRWNNSFRNTFTAIFQPNPVTAGTYVALSRIPNLRICILKSKWWYACHFTSPEAPLQLSDEVWVSSSVSIYEFPSVVICYPSLDPLSNSQNLSVGNTLNYIIWNVTRITRMLIYIYI